MDLSSDPNMSYVMDVKNNFDLYSPYLLKTPLFYLKTDAIIPLYNRVSFNIRSMEAESR